MTKKSIALLLVLALAMAVLCACGGGETAPPGGEGPSEPAAQTQFINIATGGTAGTYYPLGGAMAEIMNNNIENVNATAESTGASTANINLLNNGEVEIGLIQNDVTYYAANGIELFDGNKIEGLYALASLYPETCQIVTTADSGITSISDFAGKRIAVGAAGSGTEANARQIMAAAGITYDDITYQYLSFAEAATGLKDGTSDAAFVTAGAPTAAVMDIAAQHQLVLIPLDDATCDSLIAQYPFYTKKVIPGGTYQGVDTDVNTLAVQAMLVVTDDMTDEMAYDITKAIFTNLDRIVAAHQGVGSLITVDTALDG
ncbi:MAG: TAXI family TRAP transporter solute-binding subunit, partial [Syntrophomonadaceae bacterium]|nr:TAXI family TRAP transporter solute-binding subunit [Syntrophomonadaceae bacterium]